MTEERLKATHKGIMHIANVDVGCFVLEDKSRVISGRSLTEAIGMRGRGQGASRIPTHSALKGFISAELAHAIENPIHFKTEQELRYAKAADILIRAFATVGIIALVDEATGYQAEREKDELQKILAAYISLELMPWTRRFPLNSMSICFGYGDGGIVL
jgi:hypothetical protein